MKKFRERLKLIDEVGSPKLTSRRGLYSVNSPQQRQLPTKTQKLYFRCLIIAQKITSQIEPVYITVPWAILIWSFHCTCLRLYPCCNLYFQIL